MMDPRELSWGKEVVYMNGQVKTWSRTYNIVDAAATQWAMGNGNGNGNGRMNRSTSPGTNRQEARNRRE
jgi:hypothetical protein